MKCYQRFKTTLLHKVWASLRVFDIGGWFLLVAICFFSSPVSAQVNLALNRPVSASSVNQANSYNTAQNAVDGNTGSRWESAYSDPQWIYVDLGAKYTISSVRILWESAHAKDYRIEVSDNTTTWVSLATVTNNNTIQPNFREHTGLTGSGRYLRVYGTVRGIGGGTTLYGYSIVELQVFGGTNAPPSTPIDVNASPNRVVENAPNGTSVGLTASATDPQGTAVSYSLTDNAGGRFAIHASTGVVTVANGSLLNYAMNSSHTITVRASDGELASTANFTIAVASANTQVNLALNQPVMASSVVNMYYNTAQNAVDGNTGSRWESAYSDPQWLYVDLGARYSISSVRILWQNAHAKDYRIEVSEDAASWTTIQTVTNNSTFQTTFREHPGLSGAGRYLRIYCTVRGIDWGTTLYGYSILELEVYGTAKPLYTWKGGSGTDWNNPANWLPTGIPGTGDEVVITSGLTAPRLPSAISISNLKMNSGSLDLNSRQLTVDGQVVFAGGTVSNGSVLLLCSEVRFEGTDFSSNTNLTAVCDNVYANGSVFHGPTTITKQGPQSLHNEGAGGSVFNGVTIIKNNSPHRLRLGHTTGDDFNNSVTFERTGTGALEISQNATSRFSGNLTFLGSQPVSLAAGSGTIQMRGTQNQAISNQGTATVSVNRLTLNKAAGKVALQTPVRVATSVQLSQGIIGTSKENPLIFSAGALVSGASNASFVEGPVVRYGAGAFVFPVGKGGFYRSIAISPAGSATDAFRAEYFPETPYTQFPANKTDKTFDNLSKCEYWLLDRLVGSASTNVTLSWNNVANPGCEVVSPADLLVVHWDAQAPGGPKWVNHGNGQVTAAASTGFITSAVPLTSFSPITLGSFQGNNVLPVDLRSFTVRPQSADLVVQWSTASEHDNKGFEIQRSADGETFEVLAFVAGAGTTSSPKTYTFSDAAPLPGGAYYRLRQIDFSGETRFSKVVFGAGAARKSGGFVAPNPATNQTSVFLPNPAPGPHTVLLVNETGQVVLSQNRESGGSAKIELELKPLPKGLYYVLVNQEREVLYRGKILKE